MSNPLAKIVTTLSLVGALLAVFAGPAQAASREEIDARVEAALEEFAEKSRAGSKLMQRAAGALVFPRVIKAGIGIGGEYGEGGVCAGQQIPGRQHMVNRQL